MKKSYLLAVGGIASVGVICAGAISSEQAMADSVGASVTVPEACNITSSGDNHTAEVGNGTYVSEIGTTTFTITCNDNAGFSLYAVGYTGDEIGGTNSTKLVGTGTGTTISTGTATGSNTSDPSNWAMKLGTVTNPTPAYPVTISSDTNGSFASYHAVPESYTKVATRLSGTDAGTGAVGSTVTTTYAAYVDASQAADTYNGQVKYTLVHPANEIPLQPQTATSGCINYFPVSGTVEGTMGCQPITASATSATLLASNFSRTGYGFAGWSDVYDYNTNPNAHFYGPQEDIAFTAGQYTGSNNGLALYAVWVKSAGSLQDASKVATLCGTGTGSLTTAPTNGTADLASVSALTDQRDNQTYAIAKLADGKCWMIENLRLEAENTRTAEKQALAQGYGTSATYGNFGGLADAETDSFSNSTTANSLYYSGTQEGTASIDIGTTDSPEYRMPRYNNLNTTNRASNPISNTSTNNTAGGMYSYGNYYTWHAAIADLTYNGTKNSTVTNTSLCPSGWRLPQGGDKDRIINDDNDFWELTVDALNGGTNPANYDSRTEPYYDTGESNPVTAKLKSYPNNFLHSGFLNASAVYNRGYNGRYWSSSTRSGTYSYMLGLSNFVEPGSRFQDKNSGASIRCMVSPSE